MVRDDAQRALLLARRHDPALTSLTGSCHNLLRMWATA
jgi:predicted 2-oxoglutarate/Fe(II)-dependent dioxygenase YbiX